MYDLKILNLAEETYKRNGFVSAREIAFKLDNSITIASIKEILNNNNFSERFKDQFLRIEQEGDAELYI
jgi:hypothetical protein